MVCVCVLECLSDGVGMQVLDHALADERERIDDADGQQHVKAGAGGIDPEIADGLRFAAGNAAHQGDGDGDADGGTEEVVIGEADHLREVAHGGFGRVGLPVGVRGEGGGGVPGEIRSHDSGQVLRIPGKNVLRSAR